MNQNHNISVSILDKVYQIKCSPENVQDLQKAAMFLDQEMRKVRDSGKIIGLDRIAVFTALNLAYSLQEMEQKDNKSMEGMGERIHYMQRRIEDLLTQSDQAELL